MRTSIPFLLGLTLCVADLWAGEKGASKLMGNARVETQRREAQTWSSFDPVDHRNDTLVFPKAGLRFEEADLGAVLKVYQELSGRTVIRAGNLPGVRITLQSETPLSRVEGLQTLDTALAQHQIAMVLMGTKFVKAVPAPQAHTEPGPVIELPPDQLPDSGSYMVYIVKSKDRDATELLMMLQPFAKLPNSIVAIKDPGLLILRDYSANIRRMLQVLERLAKE
jgi:type II secretory pathway component GspD/PulD (secretin)